MECVAAHLRGCWRSLIYCGVYLLPKVLHDSSEFRFLYSLMACFVRLEATSFLSAIGVGLLIAVLSGVFTARQMKNELCVSPQQL